MDTFEFIAQLRELDVSLSVNDERLHVSAPKGALTKELREELGTRKSEILAFLRATATTPRITPTPRDKLLPASFAQERLWFLDQLQPKNSVYNISRAQRTSGEVNLAKLHAALNRVISRHESLRTTFRVVDGRPVQHIAAELCVGLPLLDLQSLPVPQQEAASKRVLTEAIRGPFDLAHGPLIRAIAARLEKTEHILLIVTHHTVSDAWSMRILFAELWNFYDSLHRGRPHQVPELGVQYADYAAWQRAWLTGVVLDSLRAFWREKLKGELPKLDLPSDRLRPRLETFRGAKQSVSIPRPVTEALRDLSRRAGVTLFSTLMAAFTTLLHRYTGQDDIIVGFPIANRNHMELENLIGLFVNTSILRSDHSDSPTFRDLLSRVHASILEAHVHQHLPFEKLVEELSPGRDLSRNPLFQAMLVLQNAPRAETGVRSLTLTPVELDPGTSKFDLTLALADTKEGLVGCAEYSTDLFEAATIERLVGHYKKLLESIVVNPDAPTWALSLLTEEEGHQLLVEWNTTKAEYPQDSCIHRLFETRAEIAPDALVLCFGDEQLTYNELNRRANQLANHLRHLGIGAEQLIGVFVEMSIELVIGLLGILKSGSAYVPLDPSYPRQRLAFMLHDSRTTIVLTQEHLCSKLKTILEHETRDGVGPEVTANPTLQPRGESPKFVASYEVLRLDSDWHLIARNDSRNLSSDNSSSQLAYTIYTSGSTGKPKGVQISHRSLVNLLTSMRDKPGLAQHDILLAVTSISFDIAALELFLPLLTGARVVLASRKEALDEERLESLLVETSGTVMQATPSAWGLLVDGGWEGDSQLKILCGGEVLPRELANDLVERGDSLWNLFGPTETTVWSAVHQVESGKSAVPIGRPIANTHTRILDTHGQLLPVIVPGELCIGGSGLARGYLGSPELTAERFLPDPYSRNSGARLYSTGDRARYLNRGDIEFLGRLDHQIKIRGYRIELGEIESALREHPNVSDTVVTARDIQQANGEGGNSRTGMQQLSLVAYVVAVGEPPTASNLRNFLRAKLPDPMIPPSFVLLDALPLTANGKLDHSALPPLSGSRPKLDKIFVPPRTPSEEVLANIWAEVLEVDDVGIHDDFFELGGYSLLATQIMSRVRDAFSLEIELRALFDAPTVAELARVIDLRLREGPEAESTTVIPTSTKEFGLSIAQEQLFHLNEALGDVLLLNIPVVYHLKGSLDIAALEESFNAVIQRHDILRTSFRASEGVPVATVEEILELELTVVDLQQLYGPEQIAELARLAANEAKSFFDLGRIPLFRVLLLRLDDEDHALTITMHHMISDGWSIGVLLSELSTLYAAFSNGRPSPLRPLPLQYADFAAWQRQALGSEPLKKQQAYWRQKLSKPSPRLIFRNNVGEPTRRGFVTFRRFFTIGSESLHALKVLSRVHHCTPFMTVLTLFKALLYSLSGERDIRVCTLVANRGRSETEQLIGLFTNTLILRTDLSGDPTFLALQRRVRQTTLEGYANQDVPFDELGLILEPDGDFNRSAFLQILFIYHNLPVQALRLPGLEVNPLEFARSQDAPSLRITAFDLTVTVTEGPNGLSGCVNYQRGLFDAAYVESVIENFKGLLELVLLNPNQCLSTLTEQLRVTAKDADFDPGPQMS